MLSPLPLHILHCVLTMVLAVKCWAINFDCTSVVGWGEGGGANLLAFIKWLLFLIGKLGYFIAAACR